MRARLRRRALPHPQSSAPDPGWPTSLRNQRRRMRLREARALPPRPESALPRAGRRDARKRRRVWSLLFPPRGCRVLALARRIHDAAGAVQLLTDVAFLDERPNAGRQRRHFIWIQGADETWG